MLAVPIACSSPTRLHRPRRSGQAAVEFALFLPILVGLSLAVIDWGWYMTRKEMVVAASQEACLAGVTVTSIGSPVTVAEATGEQVLIAMGFDAADAAGSVTATGGGPNAAFTVSIDLPHESLVGFSVLIPIVPNNLTAQHVMLMEE